MKKFSVVFLFMSLVVTLAITAFSTAAQDWSVIVRLDQAVDAIIPNNAKLEKVDDNFGFLVACRRVTITRLLASKLLWLPAVKSCSRDNSIPI
jgi:protein-arginine kinase